MAFDLSKAPPEKKDALEKRLKQRLAILDMEAVLESKAGENAADADAADSKRANPEFEQYMDQEKASVAADMAKLQADYEETEKAMDADCSRRVQELREESARLQALYSTPAAAEMPSAKPRGERRTPRSIEAIMAEFSRGRASAAADGDAAEAKLSGGGRAIALSDDGAAEAK